MTAESLDRTRGHDALGAAAHADAHVGASAVPRRVDAAGDVTVAHETRSRAGIPDLLDQLLVPWPVENRDHDLIDGLAERAGELADVLADRQTDVDHADARGARHELVHVEDAGGVEHRAAVGHRDHGKSVLSARRSERCAVDRVDRDVALRPGSGAHDLAVEEHRGVVLLSLADHDPPLERDGAEEGAHRVDRRAVGGLLRSASDEGHGTDRSRFGRTHQLHCEVSVGMQGAQIGRKTHHVVSLATRGARSATFRTVRDEGIAILNVRVCGPRCGDRSASIDPRSPIE